MEYPFRVCGRVVEIYRYRADCTEERPADDGLMEKVDVVRYCTTQEEAEQTGGTVTALETAPYAWMDGLTMPDVPDTYAEAVKAFQLGEVAYQRLEAFETSKRNDQLRADLDYVMLMGGL